MRKKLRRTTLTMACSGHCVKERAESRDHATKVKRESGAPIVAVDYVYMYSTQEKDEEKGIPTLIAKDSRTKMIAAKIVPNKDVVPSAV